MKTPKQRREILLSLLQNTIFHFFVANFSVFILLKLANIIDLYFLQILCKTLSYGFYYYLATPFIMYWLSYASQGVINKFKVITTITFMSLYSYILWDSYFFFRKTIDALLLAIDPYQW
ncbi:MAG: hypothetical protein ACFCU5_05455 [Pleurocapsa sp.]